MNLAPFNAFSSTPLSSEESLMTSELTSFSYVMPDKGNQSFFKESEKQKVAKLLLFVVAACQEGAASVR